MSRRRIYIDGKPEWAENEPGFRGRVAGYGNVSAGYFSGTVIETESERDRQLRMQREAMRKARAK